MGQGICVDRLGGSTGRESVSSLARVRPRNNLPWKNDWKKSRKRVHRRRDLNVMAYQVIARKYRPQRFSDVVGQEHVTRTLRNAIEQNRIAHAYLFVGPRGTGKTTIA